MKGKINYNLSQKLISKNREPFSLIIPNKKILNDNEEQILFNHKSSLEAALNLIKNFQLD